MKIVNLSECDRDLQLDDDLQCAEDLASRKREATRRERKQASEERARSASTWPEALRKQASLFEREAFMGGGDEFRAWQRACERALEMWSEEASKLDGGADSIRFAVAFRLETEMPEAAADVAQALRDYPEGDGDGLSEWLHW